MHTLGVYQVLGGWLHLFTYYNWIFEILPYGMSTATACLGHDEGEQWHISRDIVDQQIMVEEI